MAAGVMEGIVLEDRRSTYRDGSRAEGQGPELARAGVLALRYALRNIPSLDTHSRRADLVLGSVIDDFAAMTFHHVFDNMTPVDAERSGQEPAEPAPARIATSRSDLDVRTLHVELLPELGLGGGSFLDVRERRGDYVHLGLLVHLRSVDPC